MNAWQLFLEMWYVLIGFVLLASAINGARTVEGPRKYGVFGFWFILATLFAAGPYIPNVINGVLVVLMGLLSALKMVNITDIKQIPEQFRTESSNRIGSLIFIPSLVMAVGSFGITYFLPKLAGPDVSGTVLGYIGIGLASLVGLVVLFVITRAPLKLILEDGDRLVRTMGSSLILPQLLGALGAIFTMAGLGDVISQVVGTMIPDGNIFIGVVAYCVGMAVFTMIMGNGFAAFVVITVGIGIPYVISKGGNPAIAGALAMTAGFCGTLMTPMAANFNIVPATLLETKNEYAVMKFQVPFALTLLVVHIFLMYFLAF